MTTVPRQDRSRKPTVGNQETIWQETGKRLTNPKTTWKETRKPTGKPENNLEGNQKKCGKTCRRTMRGKDQSGFASLNFSLSFGCCGCAHLFTALCSF